MLNKSLLIGRLTADPKSVSLDNGHNYCRFSLAVQRAYARDGENKADFINIIAWDKIADNCVKYLAKGHQVAVVGSIQTGSYEKDGVKRQTFDIRADQVEFLGKPNTEQDSDTRSKTAKSSEQNNTMDKLQEIGDDDDMPF